MTNLSGKQSPFLTASTVSQDRATITQSVQRQDTASLTTATRK